jgi:hypothetical protein
MNRAWVRAMVVATVAAVSGCATVPLTTEKEPMAMETALKRARFDMNCPEATGTVLSKQTIESPVRGPRVHGVDRAEFTIGVTGCGKRQTLVVLCADQADGCFAADGGKR